MSMEFPRVDLGIEELALAMGLAGKPEVAKGLLTTVFGQLSPNEEDGRLKAAGHSLVARGLLLIQDNRLHIVDDFRQLLSAVMNNDFTIQYDRKSAGPVQALSFFVKGTMIVEQRIDHGVVYRLRWGLDEAAAVASGREFFGIDEDASTISETEVPMALLERLKEASINSPNTVPALVHDAGILEPLAKQLSDDFCDSAFRGSVMRIETTNGQPHSERGFLVLKGRERIWLFSPIEKQGKTYSRMLPGTKESFRALLRAIYQ